MQNSCCAEVVNDGSLEIDDSIDSPLPADRWREYSLANCSDRGVSIQQCDHPLASEEKSVQCTEGCGCVAGAPLYTEPGLTPNDAVVSACSVGKCLISTGVCFSEALMHQATGSPAEACASGSRSNVTCSREEAFTLPEDSSQRAVPWPVTSVYSTVQWSTVHRLGFPPSKSPLVLAAEQSALQQLEEEERKSEKHWHTRSCGIPLLAHVSQEAAASLRKCVYHYGIPRHLRGVMWLTLSGMALKMDENEYFCRSLLRKNGYVQGEYGVAIEKDLGRTFPNHRYFSETDVGVYKLNNVLHALCWRNPLLCYCQSFNYLAAFLLLIFDDEEACFWMLVYILESLLPNDFYSITLMGAKTDQLVLEGLVADYLPKLAHKFTALQFDVGALVPAWVMSLFITTFPVETVLRIWDFILVESPTSAHQRTGAHLQIVLAALMLFESDLMRCDEPGDMMILLHEQASVLYDAKKLLQAARSISLSPTTLHQRRRKLRHTVSKELNEGAKRRELMREQELFRALRCPVEETSAHGGRTFVEEMHSGEDQVFALNGELCDTAGDTGEVEMCDILQRESFGEQPP